MTDAERIDRLERAMGELQNEVRDDTGFAPHPDTDFIDGQPCEHKWVTKRMGGPPDMAESNQAVTYCDLCGYEKQD